MKGKIILLFSLILFINCSSDKVCRDMSGNVVDWYVIFLMPKSASPDDEIYYAYFDSSRTELEYRKYSESEFPPTKITEYVVNGKTGDFNYFFWNDDMTTKGGDEGSCDSSFAHAKGSLVYDSDNGAFLLHSLPRFPTRTSTNEILLELPDNAGYYGQHFLCMTVDKNTSEKIIKLLNYIHVKINASVKEDRVNSSPNYWVKKLIENEFDTNYPKEYQEYISSKGGIKFNFIGKNHLNNIIPYDTTVRDIYNDDFYVRTWTRPKIAPATCLQHDLLHVLDVQFGVYKYTKGKEHSKWAISKLKEIVCFADLNHTESQKYRGGHIVCFAQKKLHEIMLGASKTFDSCEEEALNNNSDLDFYDIAKNILVAIQNIFIKLRN